MHFFLLIIIRPFHDPGGRVEPKMWEDGSKSYMVVYSDNLGKYFHQEPVIWLTYLETSLCSFDSS